MDEVRCGRRAVEMEGIGEIAPLEAPTVLFENQVPTEGEEAGVR
jgi:hypothetical protein